MKKLEIKKVGIVSSFKAMIYLMIVPMIFMALIGVLFAVIGFSISEPEIGIIGVIYIFIPLVLLPMYGIITMLMSLIYNGLAGKFGGLEITVVEKTEKEYTIENLQ